MGGEAELDGLRVAAEPHPGDIDDADGFGGQVEPDLEVVVVEGCAEGLELGHAGGQFAPLESEDLSPDILAGQGGGEDDVFAGAGGVPQMCRIPTESTAAVGSADPEEAERVGSLGEGSRAVLQQLLGLPAASELVDLGDDGLREKGKDENEDHQESVRQEVRRMTNSAAEARSRRSGVSGKPSRAELARSM